MWEWLTNWWKGKPQTPQTDDLQNSSLQNEADPKKILSPGSFTRGVENLLDQGLKRTGGAGSANGMQIGEEIPAQSAQKPIERFGFSQASPEPAPKVIEGAAIPRTRFSQAFPESDTKIIEGKAIPRPDPYDPAAKKFKSMPAYEGMNEQDRAYSDHYDKVAARYTDLQKMKEAGKLPPELNDELEMMQDAYNNLDAAYPEKFNNQAGLRRTYGDRIQRDKNRYVERNPFDHYKDKFPLPRDYYDSPQYLQDQRTQAEQAQRAQEEQAQRSQKPQRPMSIREALKGAAGKGREEFVKTIQSIRKRIKDFDKGRSNSMMSGLRVPLRTPKKAESEYIDRPIKKNKIKDN